MDDKWCENQGYVSMHLPKLFLCHRSLPKSCIVIKFQQFLITLAFMDQKPPCQGQQVRCIMLMQSLDKKGMYRYLGFSDVMCI